VSFDFKKTLREQAEKCQDETRARLLAGQTVEGGAVEPKKADPKKEDGGTPGVRTGALLAELGRRENIQVRETGFTIRVSPEQAVKWTVYNAGREEGSVQPPRPVSGVSDERLKETADGVAREARDQFVKKVHEGLEP
jgi:hypothetical protein